MFNRLNAAPSPQTPYSPGAFPSANAGAQPWQPSQAPQQSTGTGFQNIQQPGVQAAPWENAPYGFQANPWQMQPWVPPWALWQQAGQTGAPDPAQQYTPAGTSGGIPGFDPTVPGGGMHQQQLAPAPAPAPAPAAPRSNLWTGANNQVFGNRNAARRSVTVANNQASDGGGGMGYQDPAAPVGGWRSYYSGQRR